MRLLLVGCGAIGTALVHGLRDFDDVSAILLLDPVPGRADTLAKATPKCRAIATLEEGLDHVDLVVEAASQGALRAIAEPVLACGRDLLMMSVGAFADDDFRAHVESLARDHACRVLVPSGAIGGLDALKAAREGGLRTVTLTTSKPPDGLGLGDEEIHDAFTLFEGPAREAVRRFPKNVNVAAALSLAGVGLDATRVRVRCDPHLTRNTHEIEAEGDFGRFTIRVENAPSPDNPASSLLAPYSAIALVKRLASPIQIGS